MPTINLYSNAATTLEGVSPTLTLNFTVELSEAATVSTTYFWSTLEGTATQSIDYSPVTNSPLTFAIGERFKTISVTLFNDSLVEADESFFVNLFGPVTNPPTPQLLLATTIGLITDTLKSDITASLADAAYLSVESLTLTGTANINGTGNSNDNKIVGNSGNNVLDGGFGNDSLVGSAGDDTLKGGGGNDKLDGGTGTDSLGGGAGDDLYIIDSALDIISSDASIGEVSGGGNDTIQASINYTLLAGSFIENLTLSGSAVKGDGNEYNNLITGNAGANTLTGGGNATLVGGNDTLVGLGGNDLLSGGDGNDILDGGTGLNTLVGGIGNDIYRITNVKDVITELAGQGVDRVDTASSYSIVSKLTLEDITLTGDKAVNATGNDGNNILTGNDSNNLLSGGNGNDIMDGKGGLDTLKGGAGDDTYLLNENPWTPLDIALESATGGTDTVKVNSDYTLGANFERLELLGNGDFYGYGNAQANVIFGNSGNNLLDGKGGSDLLLGGIGDDTYFLGEASTIFKENSSEGADTVIVNFATASPFSLLDSGDTQYIENITLSGPASAASGNSLGNLMIGNEGADALVGNGGNDTLVGDVGQDTLVGGAGLDTYHINIEDNDIIGETASTEIDTINAFYSGSTPATYAIPLNVEKFYFKQGINITVVGNASANTIETSTGNDSILGGDGDDTVYSGYGKDTILGGLGNDLLDVDGEFSLANPNDCLLDGGEGNDKLLAGRGNDSLLGGEGDDILDGGLGTDSLNGGNGNDVYVINTNADVIVAESLTGGTDRIESTVSYRLMANFENLTLIGTKNINGLGTGLNNVLIGNTGNNSIDGQAGDDSMDGSGGNDVLFGQAGNDTLLGGSGLDVLLGQAGNDMLDGGSEADTMQGGLGNDIYEVDSSLDLVIENLNEGTDLVNSRIASYTLTDNVENLVLVSSTPAIGGTGNALANTITGNNNSNIIDGAAGNDTMIGGDGNDKYYVDSLSDIVVEVPITLLNPNSGEEMVLASINNYTLVDNVENLTLIDAAIIGSGNALNNRILGNELNNRLNGGDGNDYLDGGNGKDTLVGGLGDDIYYADLSTDVVTEAASAGTDRLISSANQTLAGNVENLSLVGTGSLQGTGNSLNNIIFGNEGGSVLDGAAGNDSIFGNAGNDAMSGGVGNDTLTGGLGADLFDYVTSAFFSASAIGNDLLADFNRGESDKIRLGKTTFSLSSAIGANLTVEEFKSVANEGGVAGSNGIIVHSQATGNIYFNPNGALAGGDILFATTNFVGAGNPLLASDFVVG